MSETPEERVATDRRAKLREDYLLWHRAQVGSGDIDPMYPVLNRLAEAWGLDVEQRAWLVFLHVAWYHPGSTIAAFQAVPSVRELPGDVEGLRRAGLLALPCETERRGHRAEVNLVRHLLSLRETLAEGGVTSWVTGSLDGAESARDGWLRLNERLTDFSGNGRWAAYKGAEMLQKVAGFPVEAADAGHRYSTGPRKGLELLQAYCPTGQTQEDVDTLDLMTELWAHRLGEDDVAQVETSLCDFHSLVRGRYYLGHDIDSMLGAWLHPAVVDRIPAEAWEARRSSFARELLGEEYGRRGVDRAAKQDYKRTGNTEGFKAYV